MAMASSEVGINSCQSFNSVLNPHERCIQGENNKNKNTNKNNNNGRNVSEKNLTVFVRDPLDNDNHGKDILESSSNSKSSVSDDWLPEPPSSSKISNSSQQENQSRKEKMEASLVQIWEARTQHPISNQNQSQIDSRTSFGSYPNENFESLTEKSDLIQTINEGDEEQEEEKMEFDTTIPSNSGEKERVRVMDIIRKLSSDPEMINENGTTNNNNNNESSKEVNSTDLRCFPQISSTPRIRGRQAIADLLELMLRERAKELVWLVGRHCVSKFTYRGRIQSVLRIRCYERCVAVQDKHRGRSSLGSDLNRSPGGSGVKHLLRERYNSVEKKVLQEALQKIGLKESQDKINAGEIVKKDVLIEVADSKNGLWKSAGENNHKETIDNKNGSKMTDNKSVLRKSVAETVDNKNGSMKYGGEIVENKNGLGKSSGETAENKNGSMKSGGEIAENKNGFRKPAAETAEDKNGSVKSVGITAENKNGLTKSSGETAENKNGSMKPAGEIADNKNGLKKPAGETADNKNGSVKSAREIPENKNGLKNFAGETVDQKNGLRKSAENKNGSVKYAGETAENKNGSMKSAAEIVENKNGLRKPAGETVDHKNGLQKSAENKNGSMKPIGETSQKETVDNKDGFKKSIGETIVKETADQKSGLQKSAGEITQKETSDNKNGIMKCVAEIKGRGEKREAKEKDITKESVEDKSLMGIAQKVNLWNSGEKLNKRTDMVKGKASTEKNDVIEEATRRIINVETAERSISTKEVEKGRSKKEEVTTQEDKNGLKKGNAEESEKGKALMGIAEKVNLWNSKEKKNKKRAMEKSKDKTETNQVMKEASRRIIDVETAERSMNSKDMIESSSRGASRCVITEKVSVKKEEVFESTEVKSKESIKNRNNLTKTEESASDGSKEKTKEKNCSQNIHESKSKENGIRSKPQGDILPEESASNVSKEKIKEKDSLQFNKEMSNLRNLDSKNGIKESRNEKLNRKEEEEYVNGWDKEDEEEEYEYDQYNEENMYDWFDEISRPQSYWEDLRKQRYLEVLNAADSEKKGIKKLIESRTVSNFLSSELREKIDRLMISRVQSKVRIRSNTEEESEVECSARNETEQEEEEEENTNLEAVSDNCSQSSNGSTMMSWSFRDQEQQTSSCLPESSSLVPTDHEASSSSEMQMICDLKEQMEQLQREMIELRSSMKSCTDMQIHFQKSIIEDPYRSGSSMEQRGLDMKKDPLKRKCCVCSEMPVDSLLYRCGHMCTCLKCAHELQWNSKKCPVCMAPIVDVVRTFIDS